MKEITREMILMYKLNKLGFDFAGYTFENKNELSYHHLIIPKREYGKYTIENGAILVQLTSHDYLHLIEVKDRDIFELITLQMIEENINGKIDIYNLRKIRDLLLCFEKEHDHDKNKKGQYLIKRDYVERRIKL